MSESNYNCFSNGVKYKNYISLGFYCGIAMELERLGLRSVSLPFDWLITADLESVLRLVDTRFKGFLDEDNLSQEFTINPKYYYDANLKIHYYHDFDERQSLNNQLPQVKKKYSRRIERFYQKLSEPSLIIRYVCDKAEYNYIIERHTEIEEKFKQFNKSNRVFFVVDS